MAQEQERPVVETEAGWRALEAINAAPGFTQCLVRGDGGGAEDGDDFGGTGGAGGDVDTLTLTGTIAPTDIDPRNGGTGRIAGDDGSPAGSTPERSAVRARPVGRGKSLRKERSAAEEGAAAMRSGCEVLEFRQMLAYPLTA